jgi:hypothetical protein
VVRIIGETANDLKMQFLECGKRPHVSATRRNNGRVNALRGRSFPEAVPHSYAHS